MAPKSYPSYQNFQFPVHFRCTEFWNFNFRFFKRYHYYFDTRLFGTVKTFFVPFGIELPSGKVTVKLHLFISAASLFSRSSKSKILRENERSGEEKVKSSSCFWSRSGVQVTGRVLGQSSPQFEDETRRDRG